MRGLAVVVLVTGMIRSVDAGPITRRVEIAAPVDAELDQVVNGDDLRYVCTAPCTTYVPQDRSYVVTGRGLTDTTPFTIPATDLVEIRVHPGSVRLRLLGDVSEIVGPSLLAFAAVSAGADRDFAIGMAVAAVPIIVVGVIAAKHGRTRVEIVPHVELDTRRAALTF